MAKFEVTNELHLAYAGIFATGAILTVLVLAILYDVFYIPPIYRGLIFGFFGIGFWIVGLAALHLVYRILVSDNGD